MTHARRTSPAAYWVAVAAALPILQDNKLRPLLEFAVAQLDRLQIAGGAGLQAAQEAAALSDAERDRGRPKWARPTWAAVAPGERSPEPKEAELGEWKHGWQ